MPPRRPMSRRRWPGLPSMNSEEDDTMAARGPRLDLRQPAQRTFLHLLLNTLTVSVMNFTVWFAVTFWVYLETTSVFATGMIAGIFLIAIASTGSWVRKPGRPPPQEA